jgi:hypothetical protein
MAMIDPVFQAIKELESRFNWLQKKNKIPKDWNFVVRTTKKNENWVTITCVDPSGKPIKKIRPICIRNQNLVTCCVPLPPVLRA